MQKSEYIGTEDAINVNTLLGESMKYDKKEFERIYQYPTLQYFHKESGVIVKKGGRKITEKRLRVIIENCPQNHSCPSVKICPVGALVQEGFQAPTVDAEKCIKCGKCANFCPKKALVLEEK